MTYFQCSLQALIGFASHIVSQLPDHCGIVLQDGVLIQASGRGGEASTSGKGAAAAAKGRVAYVGAEPTDAELLMSRVAEDGAARQSRLAISFDSRLLLF